MNEVDHPEEYEKVSADGTSPIPQPLTLASDPPHRGSQSLPGAPSRVTQVKADIAKICLEKYFKDFFADDKAYRTRRSRFQKEISKNSENIEEKKKEFAEKEMIFKRNKRRTVRPEQFEKIKIIGRGAFGEVWLVRDKEDKQIYAMKVLKKKDLVTKGQILNTLIEKDFLSQNENPWSVQLYFAFQDQKRLYLVMEYLPGGDIMKLLMNRGVLTETETKFLIAETLLAIHIVHEQGFIHRDIKPDNLLLSSTGHVRLTDFGLSTKIDRYSDPLVRLIDELTDAFTDTYQSSPLSSPISEGRHHRKAVCSAVGTPDYIAPEVLLKREYNGSVDYWSLGAIMYEMLYGFPPFQADSQRQTALKIVHCRDSLCFPSIPVVSSEAISLIKGLLTHADERLTFEQIKAHPFFTGIDWDTIGEQPSPCVPVIRGPLDTSNFDEFEPEPEEEEAQTAEEKEAEGIANIAFMGFGFNKKARASSLLNFERPKLN